MAKALQEAAQTAGIELDSSPAINEQVLVVKNKVIIVVQCNKYGERAAEDYQRMIRDTAGTQNRTRQIVKVNNLIGEEINLYKAIRRQAPDQDPGRVIIADTLMGEVALNDLDDQVQGWNEDRSKRAGGIWFMNAMIHRMLKDGKAPDLQAMLDQLQAGNPHDEELEEAIRKEVKKVYKLIFDETDVIVCTPVVVS